MLAPGLPNRLVNRDLLTLPCSNYGNQICLLSRMHAQVHGGQGDPRKTLTANVQQPFASMTCTETM